MRTLDEMRLERISRSDDPRLPAVIKIYTEAIPASERKPPDWILNAATRKDFRLTVAVLNSAAVGFALSFVPPREEFLLVEYLAVGSDHRGQGAGGQLFDAVAAHRAGRAVLAEVETADTTAQHRRQAFYRRRGCRAVLGLDYLLPLHPAAPPMQLLAAHVPPLLSRPQCLVWLTRIYTDVYGMSEDDPRLDQMLCGVSDPVRFG